MNDDPGDGDGNGSRDDGGHSEPWEGADGPAADPVDPGDPSAENAAFVLLGALLTLFVLARIAGLV